MSTLTNVNEKIIAQRALQGFASILFPLTAFASNFSADVAKPGDTLVVPLVGAVTSTTFSYTDNSSFPYENTGGTMTGITISLNGHKVNTVDVSDIQRINSSAANLDNWAYQQGQSLGKMVLQDILSVVLTTNFGEAVCTTAAANWSKTELRRLRKALVTSDADTMRINALLNADLYDALLGDTNVVQAQLYGGAEAIRDGKIPRLMGVDLFESNIVPLNSISLAGFAAVPDAILVANRYVDPGENGRQYYITAEALTHSSGLVMGYRRHYNPGRGKEFVSFECLYGYSKGITAGLKIAVVP